MQQADRHAYLIMAHKNDLTFYTLLTMLDDPRNDIFIHMDVKNKDFVLPDARVQSSVRHSQVYFTERTSVTWAAYSQIHVKILMLELAQKTGNVYSYYHFISGEDLPIQTQDHIHSFFKANGGKEFIHYEWPEFPYQSRVRYYYFLQEQAGRGRSLFKWTFRFLDMVSVSCQKLLKVWRSPEVPFQKGEAWASITGAFAQYIWENIEKTTPWFRNTLYGDEEWFQTLLDSSPFRDRLYHPEHDGSNDQMMRLIDWKRGDPYVFRMSDWEELRTSQMCWARKFDARVDAQIIEAIRDAYGKKE